MKKGFRQSINSFGACGLALPQVTDEKPELDSVSEGKPYHFDCRCGQPMNPHPPTQTYNYKHSAIHIREGTQTPPFWQEYIHKVHTIKANWNQIHSKPIVSTGHMFSASRLVGRGFSFSTVGFTWTPNCCRKTGKTQLSFSLYRRIHLKW